MSGPFPNVVFAKARKRPAKMCGTPEKWRDDPARSKGQFPWISAGLIHFLGCSEKNKWCPEEECNGAPKRRNSHANQQRDIAETIIETITDFGKRWTIPESHFPVFK